MKRISKYSILVVGALIVVGAFSACSFHGGPEHRAQWVMEKVTKKLKLNDAQQVQLGSENLADCAMTVMATVVSRHRDERSNERLFIDAGRKVFTSDTGFNTDGYGLVLHSARTMTTLPHVHLSGLSEEHGWLRVTGGSTLAVGDRVRVVPNHVCVVMNTQNVAHIVSGEELVETIRIDARGQSN